MKNVQKIIPLLIVLFFINNGLAQEPDQEIIKNFKKAESSVVLLHNESSLIPLKRLDTLKVALVGIGLKEGCDFQGTLQKYTLIETLMPPLANSPLNANAWVEQHQKNYNLFILGINDYESSGKEAAYLKAKPYIDALISKTTTAVVVFGRENAFKALPSLQNANVLISTPYNKYSHSLAAQMIFGGIGGFGKLSENLGPFEQGKGLLSPGEIRLRYSPAEMVGMNRQLMEDSIKAIVEEGIAAGAFPGAQVLVAKEGHVIYHKAFGHQTYDKFQKVTTKDVYDFASVTKTTSALAAVMKLHGEGKFDLDAPLDRYFPKFKNSNKSELSYRSMLAHNARLRPWIPYWGGTLKGNGKYPWQKSWDSGRINDYRFRSKTFQRDSSAKFSIKIKNDLWLHKDFKEKKIYKAIKKSPLNEKEGYVYSGLLFYLLPEIVATMTQTDYETYLNQNFYHRLGAYTLMYNPYKKIPKSRIVPTERDTFFRMMQIHGWVHDEGAAMMDGVSANAGLFGSANDLAKLMQMYLNMGSFGGERLISRATLEEFTRCQYCEEGNRRGLGFDKPLIEYNPDQSSIAKDASPASFGHSGYTGTFTWADPENDLLFIFFSNRVFPTRNNRKLYEMGIRPRIHQALYDALKKD